MSIIDKEDLKYLPKTSNASIKASPVSNSIIDKEDLVYLNNTPQPKLPVSTPAEDLMTNINTLPKGNLNINTPSTLANKNLPSNLLERSLTPERIRSATPQESSVLKDNPVTFQDAINNYNQNTRNSMTTGQKVKEDINTVGLEASNNVIRPLIGYTTGAPEKLVRTGIYGTMLATGVINKKQYDQIIADEESGKTNTISGLIANDPKVGAAIKLGEDEAYRKIAGAGVETGLNFVLPKVLTGGGSVLRNTLEGGLVGSAYGVAQQAQEENPNYLQGAEYGFTGGALLSGGINILGKSLGAITSTVEKNALYKSLANTSNKEEIFNNLKTKFPEVSDNVIQGMSDDLSKINTTKGVEDYFTTITKASNIAPINFDENGFRPVETPKESLPKSQVVQEVSNISEPQTIIPKPSKNNTNLSNVSYIETIPPKVKTSKSIEIPKVDKSISQETNNYLYHGTNEVVLDSISKEGLKPGRRGQLSLSKTEDYAKSFAKEGITPKGKTNSVILRVKSNYLEGKTDLKRLNGKTKPISDKLNEILTKETIPPESLEIYKNGKWQSLKPEVKTNINEDTFKSRVFERLQKENPDLLEGDLNVLRKNLEKESEKAVKLLKEDKQKLYDIAMGKEISSDLLSTTANITLAERAIEEGNNELASKLIKNRSLAQTRRGQEIVSEKASLTDNSSSRYVKQLLSDRLDEVGKKYTDNIKDLTQKSSKQKAISKIENDVADLESRIKNKKIKTSEALALLDKLTCLA